MIIIPGFFSPGTCREIIEKARPLLQVSGVWEDNQTKITDYRKSEQAWISDQYLGMVQVVHYKTGGYYKEHTDDMGRKLTILVYLNTCPRGGATWFPRKNLRVEPETGKAVIWPSSDPETLHEAEPVLEGEKWVLTKWYT